MVFECPSDTPGTSSKNLGSAMLTVLLGPSALPSRASNNHSLSDGVQGEFRGQSPLSGQDFLCVGVGGVSEGVVSSEVM